MSYYENKTILVTGGAGSIGSEIVKKLFVLNPKSIRIFDNNETALFELEKSLNSSKIRALIGDIRDKERLNRAFEEVDIIFHAAALKHVPLCEFNPFDAVKTNVLGTQNVLDAAMDQNVNKVVLVSTDKAVNPLNVMGTTKLLAERLTLSANTYSGVKKTKFSCVRFGNVLNSRGSVVPLFNKQIKNGGPVTITDPEMTRFIMKIPDAAKLIINAGEITQGGEIFILKMESITLKDLTEAMINYLSPKYGYDPKDINMEIIGKRTNEKMYEELMTIEESYLAKDNGDLYIISKTNQESINSNLVYNSHNTKKLSNNEIVSILKTIL